MPDSERKPRILVIGDIMLDETIEGVIERQSPEDENVPVVRVTGSMFALGGAANVAANVAGLGGTVTLVAVMGTDDAGDHLFGLLKAVPEINGRLVCYTGRPTTHKRRVFARRGDDRAQLVRLDEEVDDPIPDELAAKVAAKVIGELPGASAVILSDYAKGLLVPALVRPVIDAATAAGIPVIVDVKTPDWERWAGATAIKANDREYRARQEHGGPKWLPGPGRCHLIRTMGAIGLEVIENNRPDYDYSRIKASTTAAVDCCGAGDTFTAALALRLALGGDIVSAARYANVAAGLACERAGTVAVRAEDVAARLVDLGMTAGVA